MNETKFTPGPWLSSSHKSGNSVIVIDGKEFDVATVNYPNRDANAHLIAAAPEMYAELEAAMNVFRFYQGHHAAKGHSDKEQTNKQYADRIEKLLIKARGEA